MKQRVVILHGWSGHPDKNWYPWLADQLCERGFAVSVPQLPDPDQPRIEAWVETVRQSPVSRRLTSSFPRP